MLISQPAADVFSRNLEMEQIRRSGIKSKSIWEYHYSRENSEFLSDSGYKSFYYGYDKSGRIHEYTKYMVFSDLTVKEIYTYGAAANINGAVRYNSAGDKIETIEYKYNKSGKLKTELHAAYLNTVRKWLYFSIVANINDINGGQLFADLQKDLEIEPIIEGYTITVNITDPEELNQYIVIGDEMDPTSLRFSWSQLSMESQKGLLSYEGPNRKEHTYHSKNIERVTYKYDKNGNLTSREDYNTAGDMIEKETYRYSGDNRLINFYKYNEDGKISSMETYSYNDKGRLHESSGLDPSGKTVGKLSYQYDENGNLSEKVWYSSTGEVNGIYRYTHDNQNRLTEEIKFRGENERENRIKYSYDENGNIAEIIRFDNNDKKDKLIKYIYEYY
jgi:YD repeat-containing protein